MEGEDGGEERKSYWHCKRLCGGWGSLERMYRGLGVGR